MNQFAELLGRSPQHMGVTHAASVADAVEEFEDVDGDLAAAADFVAQTVTPADKELLVLQKAADGRLSLTIDHA